MRHIGLRAMGRIAIWFPVLRVDGVDPKLTAATGSIGRLC